VSVYVHCKTHRKRSGIEMNETLNLHRQRTKWTADIELDNWKLISYIPSLLIIINKQETRTTIVVSNARFALL